MKKKAKPYLSLLLVFSLLVFVILLYINEFNKNRFVDNRLDNIIDLTPVPTQEIITPIDSLEESKGTSPVLLPDDAFDELILDDTIDDSDMEDNLPHDKLFITVERQNYNNNDLTLIIPKLNFKESIKNGTDDATLLQGPGLYEYAQLPGKGNRNVSIAAHRNTSSGGIIGEWFFYYIDTLATKDYLYLVNDSNIYQYEYDQTTIVDPYDWGPIYSQGFSCLTLTSCEPIGISSHRIIVRSKLVNIYPYSEDFQYEEKGL